ncbi:MAG: putative sulfate exporter family transporter [Pseudomonadota bacterium]
MTEEPSASGRAEEPGAVGAGRDGSTSASATPALAAPNRIARFRATARRLFPGLAVAALVAGASMLVSREHGGPVMLYALLIGIAVNLFGTEARTAPGVLFASKSVLRIGVALLGARIAADQILALGFGPLMLIALSVAATIGLGAILGARMGLGRDMGVLTGGATAICGASAALAISAALPDRPGKERDTLFTVVAVTSLSTIAMILYPLLLGALGFDDQAIGVVLGGSIHDVAQVVGAGYSVSEEAGDAATLAKLFRVALLAPVVVLVGVYFARIAAAAQAGGADLGAHLRPPAMLVGFVALATLNSLGVLPSALATLLTELSRFCLIVAIAGIGMRTVIAELGALGWKPMLLVSAETVFLLSLLILGVAALGL